MTGARLFAEMMEGYEVSHIFFVPAFMLKAFAEMEDRPIRRIMVHGEKAAAYMADGYARASGKPGVCMAQMIGASNLAAGLRDGFMAGSPIIAITGGPTPQSRYRHAYQEVDDVNQFDAVTKFNAQIDHVARMPDLIRQAFRVATSAAPGPVHLRVQSHLGQITDLIHESLYELFADPPIDTGAAAAAYGSLFGALGVGAATRMVYATTNYDTIGEQAIRDNGGLPDWGQPPTVGN